MQNISTTKLFVQTLIILLASTMGHNPILDMNVAATAAAAAAATSTNEANDKITPQQQQQQQQQQQAQHHHHHHQQQQQQQQQHQQPPTSIVQQFSGTDNPSDEINLIINNNEHQHNEELNLKQKISNLNKNSTISLTPTIIVNSSTIGILTTTTTTVMKTNSIATIVKTTPSTIAAIRTITSVPAKLSNNALIAAATTVRTYLGMQRNITLISSSSSSKTKGDGPKLTLPRPQKTDAPMLNYIFDSFSTANKHHHHDQRYGPHFEDIVTDGNVTNITVQAGSTVYLNCRISLLQDKTVSWVKRNIDGEDSDGLQLLTVGMHTYSGDNRYTMEFQYPNNWRLKIAVARKSDEGTYECQISTHPPRVIRINLHVNAPQVMIVDEYGAPLQEKYYEIDSTLQLSCVVRNVVMSSSVVFWSHGEQILNYDLTRGGISVKTELMEDGANSTLFIARINKSDSGNYTCSINSSHDYSITVHILNGESFAELHHGGCSRLIGINTGNPYTNYGIFLLTTLLLQILSYGITR